MRRLAATLCVLLVASSAAGDTVRSLIREADEILQAWQKVSPDETGGRTFLKTQTEAALAKVREAERQAPADPRVKHRLGVCLSLLEQYPEAERAFAAALDRAEPTERPTVLQDWGLCLMRQGREDDALDTFQRVLAERPDHPDTRYHMGLIYEHRGLPERARDLYVQELNINNQNAKAWSAYYRLQGGTSPATRGGRALLLLLGVPIALLLILLLVVLIRNHKRKHESKVDSR